MASNANAIAHLALVVKYHRSHSFDVPPEKSELQRMVHTMNGKSL